MESRLHSLLDYIQQKSYFRCQCYKEKPISRRIRVRMRALHIDNFDEYRQFLETHPEEMETLLETLTINLSYFFRNPETFDYIRTSIFPFYRKRKGPLRIWSAGCAHGEEPYSIAISAAEDGFLNRIMVFGTDIDRKALSVAEEGVYTQYAFEYTPQEYLEKYFKKMNGRYQIIPTIRDKVQYVISDLFDRPPFEKCDLIMCRNVLIYLDRTAQSEILRNFYDQLNDGGFLVIGKVELLIGIPEVKRFEVVSRSEHVYQKKGIAKH